MKKFTLFFVAVMTAFVFSSCKDKEDEPTTPSTIQVVNNFPAPTTSQLSKVFQEIRYFGYDSKGDLIQSDILICNVNYGGGISEKITLLNEVVKVKIATAGVRNRSSSGTSYTNNNTYSYQDYSPYNTYFLITKNQNTIIEINNTTY